MTSNTRAHRLHDLVRLLEGLRSLYEQLLEAVDAKMVALRHADVAAMSACVERETAIAKRLEERLGFRRQLMERIGPELGVNPKDARGMTLTHLAERIPDPERSRLKEVAQLLRGTVFKVAQANRVLGVASRDLLDHLQLVMASVRPKDEVPGGYSRQGTPQGLAGAFLVEAVG